MKVVPIERLRQLCEQWNKADDFRNRMGFDWMYMNAVDDLEELIEEYEAKKDVATRCLCPNCTRTLLTEEEVMSK